MQLLLNIIIVKTCTLEQTKLSVGAHLQWQQKQGFKTEKGSVVGQKVEPGLT